MEYAKEVENGQKQNDVAEKLFKVKVMREIRERERETTRENCIYMYMYIRDFSKISYH